MSFAESGSLTSCLSMLFFSTWSITLGSPLDPNSCIILSRHSSLCLIGTPFNLIASHPLQLGVSPNSLITSGVILALLILFSRSTVFAGLTMSSSSVGNLTLVLISMPGLPGSGSHGTPFMFMNNSTLYLSASEDFLLIVLHLMHPSSVPMITSPDSSLMPNQIPVDHLVSYFPDILDFGLRYHTVSPNSTRCLLNNLPLTRCLGVLPSGPILYLYIVRDTCVTSHVRIGCASLITVLYLACTCALTVLKCP